MKIRKGIWILALVVSLMLAACGRSSALAEDPSPVADESGENNILVAYFSHTGNTEAAAQKIAGYTGGTLAEIQRAEEYGDLQEEAEAEILDGVHPEITVSVDDITEYDIASKSYISI